MSIEEIAATLYRCRCELPDCVGKGAPWESLEILERCKWCRRRKWNGEARRQPGRLAKLSTPLRQMSPEQRRIYNRAATARFRKRKKEAAPALAPPPRPILIADQTGAPGERSVLAGVEKNKAAAPSPPPQGPPPAHAPGCSCTLCRIQQESKAGGKKTRQTTGLPTKIALPKPPKQRKIHEDLWPETGLDG